VILVLTAVFLATVALVVGGYVFVNRRSLEEADTARARLRAPTGPLKNWALLKDDRISDVPFINKLLSGRDWVETLRVQLERAGSELNPGSFVVLMATSGFAGMLIASRVEGFLAALAIIAIGWIAPIFWLRRRQKKRLLEFEQQLPDAIDMLVSAMKAGYSFQAATQFIGEEMIAPLGPEFSRFYDEQRLGIDVRTALVGMQGRLDSLDLKMFVTAVLIQRETGGNLGEVLQNLADLIRQRISMKSQIQTLIAEPKLSARFLAVLPIVVFLVISITNPHFFDAMTAPGSGGRMALIIAAISVAIGYMIMMKIADVDI
jgi:tight adherence protein B